MLFLLPLQLHTVFTFQIVMCPQNRTHYKSVQTQRKNKREHQSSRRSVKSSLLLMIINSGCVDGLHNFKFLGTLDSSRLTWSANMAAVAKKAWQHLRFLRLREKSRAKQSCRQLFFAPSWQGIACEPCNSVFAPDAVQHKRKAIQRGCKHSTEDHWLRSSLPGRKSVKNRLHLQPL